MLVGLSDSAYPVHDGSSLQAAQIKNQHGVAQAWYKMITGEQARATHICWQPVLFVPSWLTSCQGQ